ncbi:hypothetical protein J6590_032573, partial [Homalodisca vitripennis]
RRGIGYCASPNNQRPGRTACNDRNAQRSSLIAIATLGVAWFAYLAINPISAPMRHRQQLYKNSVEMITACIH